MTVLLASGYVAPSDTIDGLNTFNRKGQRKKRSLRKFPENFLKNLKEITITTNIKIARGTSVI
jgi:hypothetical protein